jgi:predicted heme/steroid binding protein
MYIHIHEFVSSGTKTFDTSRYNGKVKGDKIYLSILGEVYEVTNGPEFYAEGAGYHTFAGREAAVPFISGKFTEEEAAKSTDVLTDVEVFSLKTWLDFYKNEKRYSYVGRVIGRFYNADGVPTEELLRVLSRWEASQPEEPKKRKKPKGT